MKPSRSEVLSLFSYSRANGELRWRVRRGTDNITNVLPGDIAGTLDAKGYRCVAINKRQFKVHRVIWLMVYGEWPRVEIDHINKVKHDNRLCNLREASKAENSMNRGKQKNNTSGFKGVTRFRSKWRAQIQINGINRHLGCFESARAAALVYDEMAREMSGEFAGTNFNVSV